jgi:hypothetical protein
MNVICVPHREVRLAVTLWEEHKLHFLHAPIIKVPCREPRLILTLWDPSQVALLANALKACCGVKSLTQSEHLSSLLVLGSNAHLIPAIMPPSVRDMAHLTPFKPSLCEMSQIQVVGAYLGYVGYFCIAAGIGLGVSEDIGSIVSCKPHRMTSLPVWRAASGSNPKLCHHLVDPLLCASGLGIRPFVG